MLPKFFVLELVQSFFTTLSLLLPSPDGNSNKQLEFAISIEALSVSDMNENCGRNNSFAL